MRISDWSSDVCSSDLGVQREAGAAVAKAIEGFAGAGARGDGRISAGGCPHRRLARLAKSSERLFKVEVAVDHCGDNAVENRIVKSAPPRSEEHTSELQSLMRSSYAVFCLKKKTTDRTQRRLRVNRRVELGSLVTNAT